jgi:hypothetical protein
MIWLGVRAIRTKNPVVVSRSQLTVSQFDLVAQITDLTGKRVTVDDVLYAAGDGPAKGDVLTVKNLTDAKGFVSSGTYVVPLIKVKDEYLLAGLPDDPGFPNDMIDTRAIAPRIYPWTDEVRRQLSEVHEHKRKGNSAPLPEK